MNFLFKKLKKFFPINTFFFNIKEEIYYYINYILFIFFPILIPKISGTKFVIKNDLKWKEEKNSENEWFYYKKFKKKYDQINIVFKGVSFKKYEKKIDKNYPTFFVNFYKKPELKIYFIGISGKSPQSFNKIGLFPYINFNGSQVSKYSGKPKWKIKQIIKTKKNKVKKFKNLINDLQKTSIAHKKNFENTNGFSGSGIQIIFLIGSLSNKVNIYGWDYYLKTEIQKLNFFSFIRYLFQRDFKNKYQGILRKRRFFETIFNIYYASRLTKTNKYKIYSNLKNVNNFPNIIKRIKKILIKNEKIN